MTSPFLAFLAGNFTEFKHVASNLGRRKAKLQLLSQFWDLNQHEKERLALLSEDTESHAILSEALKEINQCGGVDEDAIKQYVNENVHGIIVRSDFSDEDSWLSFIESLLDAEMALFESYEGGELIQGEDEMIIESSTVTEQESSSEDSDSEASDEGSDQDPFKSNFALLSPPQDSHLGAYLTNISNLGALRLLNDANVTRVPWAQAPRLPNTRSQPPNRLTGLHGFVETYNGPFIWIYDTRSNTDKAVRVVSQGIEGIGSATGDSWRARVSFIPELQTNLANGSMKIDFGGLDKWDANERQRNFSETDLT